MLLNFKLTDNDFIIENEAAVSAPVSINYIKCHFDITASAWKDVSAVVAVFKNVTYNKVSEVLLDSNNNCFLNYALFKNGGTIQVKLAGDRYLPDAVHTSTHITNVIEFVINPDITVPTKTPSEYDVFIAEYEIAAKGVEDAMQDLETRLDNHEFDGPQGVGIESVAYDADGHVIITLEDGSEFTSEISMRGPQGIQGEPGLPGVQGDTGPQGLPGANGLSPTVSFSEITGGHSMTVVDADGTHSINIMDGGGVQSDWNETNSEDESYIKNKPALATVATSGNYNDLSNKPPIHNMPSGGANGQVLTKLSNTDYLTRWEDPYWIDQVAVNGTPLPTESGTVNIPAASSNAYGVVKVVQWTDPPARVIGITGKGGVTNYAPIVDMVDGASQPLRPKFLPDATQSVKGAMSASDKTKLDGIATGADVTSVTQTLTSGTEIGSVNGTKLYAPTAVAYTAGTGISISNGVISLDLSQAEGSNY